MKVRCAIFFAKRAVRSETNDAPAKSIAAKAPTCLRRGRITYKAHVHEQVQYSLHAKA